MNKSDFGVFGLGVMGKSISLNIAEKGFQLSVYNRIDIGELNVVKNFIHTHVSFQNILAFTDLLEFVKSLKRPRKILLMIKAGSSIDSVLETLSPLLSENDIIIDGGNSHYLDTNRRIELLEVRKIKFVGCGISGGEEGARKGPSIMPGGLKSSYDTLAPILESIAAKDSQNKPCCSYIGPKGAGHFVKMVHNGIEYSEMQLLAELYALMATSMDYSEISDIFSSWNSGELSSYLLEITIDILQKKEGDSYLLDAVLDKAGNKGTGSWSTITALDLGFPNTMMSSAVFARYLSAYKETRKVLSLQCKISGEKKGKLNLQVLKDAYIFARIINHHQGFELMREASLEYNWNLNLSEIARIWTNGCIIRSDFMNKSIATLKEKEVLLRDENILKILETNEVAIAGMIKNGLSNRIALDAFWSSYNYWVAITTKNSSANLIQAQRDYFGAHSYQRIDTSEDKFFHSNWRK